MTFYENVNEMLNKKKPVGVKFPTGFLHLLILNLQLKHSYIPGVGVVGAGSVGAGSEGVGSDGVG